MKCEQRFLAIVLAVGLINIVKAGAAGGPVPAIGSNTLASPESFSSITDPRTRSAAYFTELGKVLTHPRCANCHPADDRPRQGDMRRLHQPPVFRGTDGSCRARSLQGISDPQPFRHAQLVHDAINRPQDRTERVPCEQRVSRHLRQHGGVLIDGLPGESFGFRRLQRHLTLLPSHALYLHLNARRSVRRARSNL